LSLFVRVDNLISFFLNLENLRLHLKKYNRNYLYNSVEKQQHLGLHLSLYRERISWCVKVCFWSRSSWVFKVGCDISVRYCTRIGIICTVLYTIGYANLYSTAVQYSRVPYCVCSNINENGKTTSNSCWGKMQIII